MVLDRSTDHGTVAELSGFLREGDLLVVNDTRVFPARLRGQKETGGRVEVLLLGRLSENGASHEVWRCMLGSSRGTAAGQRFDLGPGLTGAVVSPPVDGQATVELHAPEGVSVAVERLGEVPLPPYIRRPEGPVREDRDRYQTVFARETGAAAAPTAGLHFTPELLGRLEAAGVRRVSLTLHVGLGTFQPVQVSEIASHRMHAEYFRIPEETAREVGRARQRGGRVVAVGTTVVRALEYAGATGELKPSEGWCDLFIIPGFVFRQTDLLLTNFHLPGSTLLMLVSAFVGRERILAAYREAIQLGYRFYSYGDAMLLTRQPGGDVRP
jgi:S-adenosylmethionine:tRNA ribosyltransferase-isomerase